MDKKIVLENEAFILSISETCCAESLILRSSGAECLHASERLPLFTLTEDRPYNNEIKLAHPTRRTVFSANRVRMQDGRLIVGFEHILFEAIIDIKVAPRYMIFTLVDFLVREGSFGVGVNPMLPPVKEFRMLQLPVAEREHFGDWLNVAWDGEVAVGVLGASPYSRILSDRRDGYRVLCGETLSEVKLKGEGIALVVSERNNLLDTIDAFERDNGLPLGVESRRSPMLNRSYYWTSDLNPNNVDRHIEYAKRGGFRLMLLYYTCIVRETGGFRCVGDYGNYRPEYPRGREDVAVMLDKIKAAGIIPGLHVLPPHVGMRTKYLMNDADHRLSLTRYFTLSKPLGEEDETVFVEEDPTGSPVFEKNRVLKFGGELIQYDSYTTERPYCFTGCKRGYNDTRARSHEIGTIGGILDVSEFCGNSVYVDQRTSLQDELAEGIADIYSAGFEFLYFDGSEGTNPPFDINVGLAQWRVYKKLPSAPIFCEGAAKSHFSWHILSGGNAFDCWPPDVFRKMIATHPFKEAQNMANDFTRVNFGWWRYKEGMTPDIIEYGTALAAARGCPGSFNASLHILDNHPLASDVLETLRRWEDARAGGFITSEIKGRLARAEIEHTLLINEEGEYELAEWEQVKVGREDDIGISAFVFVRKGHACAALWSNGEPKRLDLRVSADALRYRRDIASGENEAELNDGGVILPVDRKRYLITELSRERLIAVLEAAALI